MFGENKSSHRYMEQISRHVGEKTSLILETLRSDSLPKAADGKVVILELGIGSGDSAKKFQNESGDEVIVFGIDSMPELASRAQHEIGISSVVADAAHLPLRNESLAAINASAVFHEISSYGTISDTERIYGMSAIDLALREANRVLKPRGLLAFRDVAGPIEDFFTEKKVCYRERSLRKFVDWFLPDFLNAGPALYPKASVQTQELGDAIELTTPVGLHREIQRHYLTLRHYVRMEYMGTAATEPSDKKLDEIIFQALSDVSNDFRKACEEWKSREGTEWYTYATPTDTVIAACKKSDEEYVLFPESPDHLIRLKRQDSNEYLAKVIDNPEFDGKLVIGFRKMKKDEALRRLQDMFISDERTNAFMDYQRILTVLSE